MNKLLEQKSSVKGEKWNEVISISVTKQPSDSCEWGAKMQPNPLEWRSDAPGKRWGGWTWLSQTSLNQVWITGEMTKRTKLRFLVIGEAHTETEPISVCSRAGLQWSPKSNHVNIKRLCAKLSLYLCTRHIQHAVTVRAEDTPFFPNLFINVFSLATTCLSSEIWQH